MTEEQIKKCDPKCKLQKKFRHFKSFKGSSSSSQFYWY